MYATATSGVADSALGTTVGAAYFMYLSGEKGSINLSTRPVVMRSAITRPTAGLHCMPAVPSRVATYTLSNPGKRPSNGSPPPGCLCSSQPDASILKKNVAALYCSTCPTLPEVHDCKSSAGEQSPIHTRKSSHINPRLMPK